MSVNVSRVPAAAIATITSLEARKSTFGAFASDTTVAAFLRLRNPADLTAIAGGASQTTPDNRDDTTKFVTEEVAYLSRGGFASFAARRFVGEERSTE